MARITVAGLLLLLVASKPALAQLTAKEPSNAPAVFAERDGRVSLTYDGVVIFEGTIKHAGVQPDFRSRADTINGAVTQVMKWTVFDDAPISLSGVIHASDQSFPAEVDRRVDAMQIVRNSVGLSHSLLNRAVYDRAKDWVVSVDYPAQVTVTPLREMSDSGTFGVAATGSEIELRFRPRYYSRHRGLAAFRPWTYRVKRESVAGWSSWYAYRDSVTQDDVERVADILADSLEPYGYHVLQIDDGFQQLPIGVPDHWLNANSKFPAGLGNLSKYISSRGLTPGLWTNVTFHDPGWARAHPRYFVRDSSGAPAYGNWIGFVMDGSNSATLDTLVRPVYRGLAQEGWRYFKVDALRHLRYEGYNSHAAFFAYKKLDIVNVYRNFVQSIRDEIGPTSYLLASWGPRPELIGIIDATRLGDDGFGYGGFAQYNSFNNVVWRNDPDHVQLTRSDAYRSTSLTSLTGSILMLTDRAQTYASSRVQIARAAAPVLFTLPQQLYDVDPSRSAELPRAAVELSGAGPRPFEADQRPAATLYLLDMNRSFGRWTVLARIPGGAATIPLSELGLAPDSQYVAFEFWSHALQEPFSHTFSPGPIDSTFGVQVFCIHQRESHPQFLSTSRHVSCGGPNLSDLRWSDGELSGVSDVVANEKYTIYTTEPDGWLFDSAHSDPSESVTSSRVGGVRIIQIAARQSGRVNWTAKWAHARKASK
ncbi:MAG: alpha-galactosidase [Gemmatimonadaceae bacterium]